jgi:hypothetical protein
MIDAVCPVSSSLDRVPLTLSCIQDFADRIPISSLQLVFHYMDGFFYHAVLDTDP